MALRENSTSFAGEFVFQSTVFCIACLVACWIGFLCHVAITPLYLPLSAVFVLTTVALRSRDDHGLKWRLLVLFGVALVMGLSVLVSDALFDMSWDGNSYHQTSVIALIKGWNPVYAPHVVAWWSAMFPDQSWLGHHIVADGLWTDHYPKAAWLLGATMASATNSLDTSKWPQIFLMASAMLAIYRGLALVGVLRSEAAVLAMVAALSPVAIVQTGTNYVDGLMASALLIQIGAAMSWLSKGAAEDLLISTMGAIISSNLKFTGLVYSVILAIAIIAATLRWRRQWQRADVAMVGIGIVIFLVVSCQTYGLNLTYGHPFYPLNKIDIMIPFMDPIFLAFGKWTKFFISLFSEPSNSKDATPVGELFLPGVTDYARMVLSPNTRVNGFGSLFGWSLILSLAGVVVCWCSAETRRRLGRNGLIVMILLAGTVASVCVNPELWHARYVPQFWFVPVLAASLAFMADRKKLATLMLVPALVGSMLCLEFWVRYTVAQQSKVDHELAQIAATRHVQLLNGWNRDEGVFTFVYRAQKEGVDVRFTNPGASCPAIFDVGLVGVCQSQP